MKNDRFTQYEVPLQNGSKALLIIPMSATDEELEKLKQYLEMLKNINDEEK